MSAFKEHKKITVPIILRMKQQHEPVTMLTAYDVLMAEILDESGIDIILVGDSGGMVLGGHENTLAVSMEEMLLYTKSVKRGVKRALVIADMPFLSYQARIEDAIYNAGLFLKEGGAEAVKIEGGEIIVPIVEKMVAFGIPVMGHLGLTPQSIHQFGGYGIQGKSPDAAQKLLNDAKLLQEAGVFSIVLEKIPATVASKITDSLQIPTIGIGAGAGCDGQVLVSHDMLGLYTKFRPKFVRKYAELGRNMREAFIEYIEDVKNQRFPGTDESY